MSEKSLVIKQELEAIRSQHDGILKPEDVVDSARSKKSPLHDSFTWDDTEAAKEYRLWQARQLIAVHVQVIEDTGSKARTYVSLKTDRVQPGGGYRALVEVLSDKSLREQLLREALQELQVFERKYKTLTELSPVFAAAKKVTRRLSSTKSTRKQPVAV